MASAFLPMKELVARMREHPIRRALIPLECCSSWWVPIVREGDGKLYLTGFLYPVTGRHGQSKQVGRPCFHITVDPENGRLVQFTDCAFQHFAPDIQTGKIVGTITVNDLPAKTIPELEHKRDELCDAYDRVLDLVFKPIEHLTSKQRNDIAKFKQLFNSMVEPFLLEFYRALNPFFFGWLDKACA